MTGNARIAHEAGSTSEAASRYRTVSIAQKGIRAMNITQETRTHLASRDHHGPRMSGSPLTVPVLAAAFLIGLAEGAVAYSHRSSILEQHVAGTNAITVHVVLAIVAAAAVIAIQLWRRRQPGQPGPSPWSAPFSSEAVARMRRTIRLSRGAAAARLLPIALLILVLLYCPYRMGAQIIGGIDPNSTVNAWGGPTYAGALLAHWLDCIVGFYVAAFLLGRLLAAGNSRGGGRGQPPSSTSDS
jgi:hypothetical protein